MALNTIIIALLMIIAYEDIRFRFVHVFLFPLLIAGILFDRMDTAFGWILVTDVSINLAYLIFLFGVTLLFFKIRGYQYRDFHKLIGIGDVLFLIAVACWFDPASFIFFISGSFIFSLFLHLILKRIPLMTYGNSVPLAGFQSLCFLGVFMFNLLG